jgi:PAS domain S-box-containing protein
MQIKNDTTEGEEFITKAQMMQRPKSVAGEEQGNNNGGANAHNQQQNDFDMMFADDTAIVVISGNKDSQAKIMKTNNGITKLFGYNTFEVHGHEVNILMPPIIGVKHSYFLDSFFKTGKERVINTEVSSFAMLRAGHIFAISLIVKPVPSLKNDIQYIGLMKPMYKDYDYILTDQQGRIDSISKGITSLLQLQPSFFKENEVFIQVICP